MIQIAQQVEPLFDCVERRENDWKDNPRLMMDVALVAEWQTAIVRKTNAVGWLLLSGISTDC